MHNTISVIRQAFRCPAEYKSNKMRTFHNPGIIIGVTAVIALITIVDE
ncbi:MAG: hypothetical protein ACLUOI_13775 [Eisenbergiella sp.]